MEWILVNQQAGSTFASLGTQIGDLYVPNKNCIQILMEIHNKLTADDKVLRSFRRAINFSQALKTDFIPLLINSRENAVVSAVIRILASILVPTECLLPADLAAVSNVGRITLYELNTFLANSKTLFIDPRTTKAILEFMKTTAKMGEDRKILTREESENINNCLLLLRNILHIPDTRHNQLQNQIVWNMFVQNLDNVLIHLMVCDNKDFWSVAMVQLIAVLYKDQRVSTLQKLINVWFERSLSESSEDNESNTTPDQRSYSSPVLTSSDPTSDSSDTGLGGQKDSNGSNHEGSSGVPHVVQRLPSPDTISNDTCKAAKMLAFEETSVERKLTNALSGRRNHSGEKSGNSGKRKIDPFNEANATIGSADKSTQHHRISNARSKAAHSEHSSDKREASSQEFSDCGYVSHVEIPEVVSTSSNEEEAFSLKRPVHVKPHIQKTRKTTKPQTLHEKKENRRKKLIKRSKATIINIKAIANHVPSEEDITHILKEFTVDFLLNGYRPLVKVLHSELLLTNLNRQIDTSHFFWLMSYFLKFVGQLELDLDHVRDVLNYNVISYLVYEGVVIAENVEVSMRTGDPNMKSFLRRQHLVVTAIREFILLLEVYGKVGVLSNDDKETLRNLQSQISSSNDLKCLFVMLLRRYKNEVHSKQYLEDLIVTNHIFLSFLEHHIAAVGAPQFKGCLSMQDHIKQFAAADVMKQYGILLEDFQSNGEYINDCVFTMMHHVGGDINQVACLCQPNILKVFTHIWESDFELCDDWSDLIEYVIHRFVNIPRHCPIVGSSPVLPVVDTSTAEDAGWSKEECENLYWYFALSSSGSDLITSIIKLYEENGVIKTRLAVIERLAKQGVIHEEQYKQLLEAETQHSSATRPTTKQETLLERTTNANWDDEVHSLREALLIDDLGMQLSWLQNQLLETCYVKLVLAGSSSTNDDPINQPPDSVPYHYCLMKESIPLVVWNTELATAFRKKSFQNLLRKLGFDLPGETGKLFYRIPSFWTADVLFTVAQQLGPIDSTMVKFDLKDVLEAKEDVRMIDTKEKGASDFSQHFAVAGANNSTKLIKHTPLPNLPSSWLDVVKGSKVVFDSALREAAAFSVNDETGASAYKKCDINATDLNLMCVSDEEESHSTSL